MGVQRTGLVEQAAKPTWLGQDLFIDARVSDCSSSLVPSSGFLFLSSEQLAVACEERSIAECIHGCSMAIVCFMNLGAGRGRTEYFKEKTEK